MREPIAAFIYGAATGSLALLIGGLAALPLHGQARGLVFVIVTLAAAALIPALTPRHTSTDQEDGDQ